MAGIVLHAQGGYMTTKDQLNRLSQALVLLVLLTAAASLTSFAQGDRECSDPIPTDCKTVRYLGEMDGCACFVCNPDKSNEQAICSRDPRSKEELLRKPHA
jgi:hypothetical protein